MADAQPERFSDAFLRAVGAVVVAGEQVEHELHRLLLSLRGESPSALGGKVRMMTWGDSLDLIEAHLARAGDPTNVAEVLSGARELALQRHNVVHTGWYADGYGARFPRPAGQPLTMLSSAHELERLAERLHDLASRIIAVTGYPRAALTDVRRSPTA